MQSSCTPIEEFVYTYICHTYTQKHRHTCFCRQDPAGVCVWKLAGIMTQFDCSAKLIPQAGLQAPPPRAPLRQHGRAGGLQDSPKKGRIGDADPAVGPGIADHRTKLMLPYHLHFGSWHP